MRRPRRPPGPRYYRLIGKLAVPCSIQEAGKALDDFGSRIVGQTDVGPMYVSTVFLCLDHNFFDSGDPLIFETMIFDDEEDDTYQVRTSTWGEAEHEHAKAVEVAKTRLASAERLLVKQEDE
jgi:hypothetical protein